MRDMTEEWIRTGMGRTKAHMIKGLVESGSGDSKAMEESEGKAILAAESLAKDLRRPRKRRPLPQNTMAKKQFPHWNWLPSSTSSAVSSYKPAQG
ncbi:hypothetical protein MCOR17_010302 [Pyricularia oryzae]|uniref:Uncharacterized protein n=1 Tax=Pyricularia oryzae TaxID=318829 RepID=A0A4P7NIA1_PYROR|nr:hypothetical protein MCOR17_010302 [Pyricularia oryzae]KAI6479437.1 hypothetical protein MCOR13_011475 [Pyricularia oryzae]QBZ61723.1 hypothetical protein PoMZ_08679 [Pyricularia oryzae]